MMSGMKCTPPAANGCRRMTSSDPCAACPYSAKRARSSRRKRLEVQRLRSGGGGDDNKRTFQNKVEDCAENQASELSLSYTSSSDPSSENDVISPRISSDGEEAASAEREKSRSSGCGSISVIGRRREMEDAVTVELGFLTRGSIEYDFYGVYDGHGGSRVAHACCDRLHRLLVEEIEGETKSVDWEKVMGASFGKMDEEVRVSGRREVGAEESAARTAVSGTIGSTAVVAVVRDQEVVVANCGDSRAVLSRGGVAVSMSNDHKPDRPDELERIESAGGRVINWNGNRVLGVLATSRSIGDHYLKPFVIPKPEVKVIKRTSADEFLILASDGLWDVVSNVVACQVVRRCLDGRMNRRRPQATIVNGSRCDEVGNESRAAMAAAVLAELAMARGSSDNISVVVVELNRTGKCTL